MIASNEILIQTEDIVAAARFYEAKMGLRRFFYGPTLIGLEAGPFRLYLFQGPACGPVFEFLVRDFDLKRAELLASGCQIEQEDPDIARCYLRDPFGMIFNLAAQPDPPA